jgi:hypothetical protein
MQDFHTALDNDDPLARVAELHHWYIALFLIGSNFAAWFGARYFYRVGLIWEMSAVVVASVFSIAYHSCQTLGVCDHLDLTRWTFLDHTSAAAMLAMLTVATINSHRMSEVLARYRVLLLASSPQGQLSMHHMALALSAYKGDVKEGTEAGLRYLEEVALNHKWSDGITYIYLFVVFLSTVCHPFSMQNNLIVIAVGMGVVLLKLTVIDDGDPGNLLARISLPDLVVGLVLIGISLVFFVLDGFVYYWIFHTLWHFFSFIGVYFYAAGITKNLPFSYSPVELFQEKVRYSLRVKRSRMWT